MWIERADVRLVTDAETRYTPSGSEVVNARVGFPAPKNAPEGAERVWYSLSAFDAAAEALRGAAKGSTLVFKGRVESRSYTTRDGTKKVEPSLIVSEVYEVRAPQPFESRAATQAVGARQQARAAQPAAPADVFEGGDEDLPF